MGMKDMIFPHSSSSTSPSMHEKSHIISKFKPKIRIIHIFAPEIIKTDVANFQELVQKLTGKPEERKKKTTKKLPSTSLDLDMDMDMDSTVSINDIASNKSMQLQGDEWLINGEKVNKEELNETWDNGDSSRSFLDGFIQELNDSSYMPMKPSHPHMGCV